MEQTCLSNVLFWQAMEYADAFYHCVSLADQGRCMCIASHGTCTYLIHV